MKQAIENELNFETIGELYPHWKEWKYQVKVKLSLYEEQLFDTHQGDENQNDHEETFSLELLTGHVVMLLNNPKLLSALLEIEPDNHQYWMAPSKNVLKAVGRIFVGDDDWICQASCFQLASRFYPEGLNIILTFFEQREMKDELIEMTHQDGNFSPLHCASFQPESLGTRYQTAKKFELNALKSSFFSILLHHGAKSNCRDDKGRTPLHFASMTGALVDILELKEKGNANPNVQDNDGKTPLFYAKVKPNHRY